ncbi:hypothetical protein [Halobacillus campisalis]|uniref:Uncharacterized protein n=1 Tax=Halobacillus campisalis TaxID=435909 RepID=A0ABW2K4C9_9BACI|nr:hypothetical protein [Halobacillus campisalis]
MQGRTRRYVIMAIIILGIFFSLKILNDYREKSLVDVISYHPGDYQSLGFTNDRGNVSSDQVYEWWSYDKEPADELIEFLRQYRVKKIKYEKFEERLTKEESFEFAIRHSNANPVTGMVMENVIHMYNEDYYEVVNGPVNMEWIEEYSQTQEYE